MDVHVPELQIDIDRTLWPLDDVHLVHVNRVDGIQVGLGNSGKVSAKDVVCGLHDASRLFVVAFLDISGCIREVEYKAT